MRGGVLCVTRRRGEQVVKAARGAAGARCGGPWWWHWKCRSVVSHSGHAVRRCLRMFTSRGSTIARSTRSVRSLAAIFAARTCRAPLSTARRPHRCLERPTAAAERVNLAHELCLLLRHLEQQLGHVITLDRLATDRHAAACGGGQWSLRRRWWLWRRWWRRRSRRLRRFRRRRGQISAGRIGNILWNRLLAESLGETA